MVKFYDKSKNYWMKETDNAIYSAKRDFNIIR